VADERPRQIENIRLIGGGIDQLTITSPAGDAIVSYIRSQPEAAKRTARKTKTR
jgi:hypothetical protein